MPQVAPTLRALHPDAGQPDTLLSDAMPLLSKLRPAVHSLANTANVGVPVINSLVAEPRSGCSGTILPGLNETTPETRGHPPTR